MRSAGARTVIGIALAGLIALGAGACAPVPQVLTPLPSDIRAQISRVGIFGPPPLQFTYVEPRNLGAGRGYLRGAGVCFVGMMSGGASSAAPAVYLMMAAAAIVGCPTIGGAVGAVQNPSDAEVAEARAALESRGDAGALGDALRGDLVALLARDAPQYAVDLLAPAATDGPPLETAADTVIVLENLTVELLRCDAAAHIAPPLTLYAAVEAQLLQGAPRPVLHHARFEYWGESATFGAWGAADAERFAQGLASARRSLAEQIVQSFFVAQTQIELKWPHCGNRFR
jgi:hypothetical protein